MLQKFLSKLIFTLRWILYPINVGLFIALGLYIGVFLSKIYSFLTHGFTPDMEHLMVILLEFVDASMVASLIVMIAQGGHQIFIKKFDTAHSEDFPQYLDHIDTGILKVKIAQSIAGITLIQILKDFVSLEHVDWDLAVHRMIIHGVVLLSAVSMALIWRIVHPPKAKNEKH
jgi:uncharacterized protein (TIGR00645 family)